MPASALAAGEWLPAQKLTAADMTTPQLGVYANGETIAAWSPRYPGSDPPEVTVRPPGGAFGAPQAVPDAGGRPMLALNEVGGAALGWSISGARRVAAIPRGGSPTRLGDVEHGVYPMAVDSAGNVYVTTLETLDPAGGFQRVGVTTLPADGGPPVHRTVAEGEIHVPAISVDAAGTTTVAWADGETIDDFHMLVATAAPGEPFGAPVDVSGRYTQGWSFGEPDIASNARGDVLVVWAEAAGSGPAERYSEYVKGAFRPAGGSFGPVEDVPIPDYRSLGALELDSAMSPRGETVVAWSNGGFVSMTYRPPGGPFEPAHNPNPFPICCASLNPVDSDPSVAIDPTGNAMVAYVERESGDNALLNVVRHPHDGAFSAPQSAFAAHDIFAPDIGLDGAGRGVLVWSPQEELSSADDRNDHGIYTSDYNPAAPPRVTRILVQRPRQRFGVQSTDQGHASLIVQRRDRRGRLKQVLAKRRRVVPGYNALPLGRRELRRLRPGGRYVATVRIVDARGHASKPRRARFSGF